MQTPESSAGRPPALPNDAGAARVLASVLGVLAVIQVRGDGYFPFPKSWPESLLLPIVLGHAVLLWSIAALGARCLLGERHTARSGTAGRRLGALFHHPEPRLLAYLCAILIGEVLGIAGLHVLQARHFSAVGYTLNVPLLAVSTALALAILGAILVRRATMLRLGPGWFLAAVLAGALLLKLPPLFMFPVTAKRSDMLPILFEAGRSLLSGQPVYQYYLLDNLVRTQTVRLPGLILAYAPAVALGIDLRWMSLAWEALAFGLLFLVVAPPAGDAQAEGWGPAFYPVAGLAVFLLLPYWHYRHELYESPFWVLTIAALMAFHAGRWALLSALLGAMAGTHQWGWLFAPFFGVALLRRQGLRTTALVAAGSAAVAAVLLVAVIRGDWGGFYENVFAYYRRVIETNDFYPMSMDLAPWFSRAGKAAWMMPLLGAGQLLLLAYAYLRAAGTRQLCAMLALSLTLQLMLNPVVWTYQYLLVGLLLLAGLAFASRQAPDGEPGLDAVPPSRK